MSLIELRAVRKVYEVGSEQVRALDGVDLDVERGEYLAITGSSGSGKSTLMNLLGCLDTPSEGSYLLNGHAVEGMKDEDLAGIRNKEIGFVFQTFNLLGATTALQNSTALVYAAWARRPASVQPRRWRGWGRRPRQHMPNELSGGQRQRVAIARARSRPAICSPTSPRQPRLATSEDIRGYSTAPQRRHTVCGDHEPNRAHASRKGPGATAMVCRTSEGQGAAISLVLDETSASPHRVARQLMRSVSPRWGSYRRRAGIVWSSSRACKMITASCRRRSPSSRWATQESAARHGAEAGAPPLEEARPSPSTCATWA